MSISVVYDTMLFFQAASRPHRISATWQAIQDRRITLSVSLELLAEIKDVLSRPEYRAKFPALTAVAVDAFIADISAKATIVQPVPHAFTWSEHPDDDHVFNLAICAQAEYLVTWEKRILKLPGGVSPAAISLQRLAPRLQIVNPEHFAQVIYPRQDA